jgi:hypothetical protein
MDDLATRLYEAVMMGWLQGAMPSPAGWEQALWVLCYALAPFPGFLPIAQVTNHMDFVVTYEEHTHPDLGQGVLTIGTGHTLPGALTAYTFVEFRGTSSIEAVGPNNRANGMCDDVLVETGSPLGLCLYSSDQSCDVYPIDGFTSLIAARSAGLKLARILEHRFGLMPEQFT